MICALGSCWLVFLRGVLELGRDNAIFFILKNRCVGRQYLIVGFFFFFLT
jgi:hypothetical protein